MEVNLNISVRCEGPDEIEALGAFVGAIEEQVKELGSLCHVGATRKNTGQTASEAQAAATVPDNQEEYDASVEEGAEELVVSRRTYCHQPTTESLFILEKGDTRPTDPSVEFISKKTYEELEAKYAPAEAEPAPEEGRTDDANEQAETIDMQKDLIPAFKQLANQKGPAAAKALITEFGVQRLTALDEADYPEAMQAIKAALK